LIEIDKLLYSLEQKQDRKTKLISGGLVTIVPMANQLLTLPFMLRAIGGIYDVIWPHARSIIDPYPCH